MNNIHKIFEEQPYKLVISKPVLKKQEIKKINILLKDNYYQVERYTDTQVFHKNINFSEIENYCINIMHEYMQLNAWSEGNEMQLLISKKGNENFKIKTNDKNAPKKQTEHNRKKQYILKEGEIIPPLVDMGIFTKEGKIVASMQDKYRQINRFVEIIDDEVKKLDIKKINEKGLKIVDFGCGKSYLTFILYYYFTIIKKINVNMTGLDLKEKVIQNCNKAASKYGYDKLHFEMGDINGYKSEKPADIVITLHACDTATDYALFHAVCWNAKMIFSVPCCQHELNKQFKSETFSLLGRYGIIKERMSALLTDSIRANLLECCGYKTQIIEFVDFENTPKNLLIRAVKDDKLIKTRNDIKSKENYLKEVEAVMKEFNFMPTFYSLLKNNEYSPLK